MANITSDQLRDYKESISSGDSDAIARMYSDLYDQGYNYAGWAEGVAKGNSFTGSAAIDFLKESYSSGACEKLSDDQINKIRRDMAQRTLDEYIRISDANGGTLNRDLRYEETKSIHDDVFRQNGLSLENWTLDLPMELIRQKYGDQTVEKLWQQVRDTGGDYLDSWIVSSILANFVKGASNSRNPEVQDRARKWLQHVEPKWMQGNSLVEKNPCDREQKNLFSQALGWVQPRDPLVLDIDGDGIEISVNNAKVLFDHNADGIKTGTQWVNSDDGMLVRDINANGSIDSGRELFGDQTLLSNGSLAANGFSALADLDINGDGLFDANDAAYTELRVWRDLNQNGVSDEGELQSLVDAGITSINLGANSTGTSSYTRTITAADGGISSVTRTVQNVNFQTNNFYSEFTSSPEVTEAAADLPQIQGAGMVRGMREAMSLGTAQSTRLEQALNTFKAASSTQERQSLLDQVINAWSETSSQADGKTRNAATTGGWYNATVGDALVAYAKAKPAEYAMMTALERFNGQAVLERYVHQRSASYYEPSEARWKGYTYYVVEIEAPRVVIFAQAYNALKASVYQSLYLQTAGQELLDQVELRIDENSISVDFSTVNAAFATKAAQDPALATVELAEFLYFAGSSLQGSDWDGAARLADLLETTPLNAGQTSILAGFKYKFSGALGDTTASNLSGDYYYDSSVLVGRAGNDVVTGGSLNDILIGGQGNDQLFGGYGNDQLVGGQGNDYLSGQWGTDIYYWGAGQGNDYIADGWANAGEQNVVVLRDLNPTDITVELVTPENYTRFRLTIIATGEVLTLDINTGWYSNGIQIQGPIRLAFSDGSQWSFEEVIGQTVPLPTSGDDFILGTQVGDRPDRLNGGAGDDIIVGRGGADVIEGGAGNDMLYGNAVLTKYLNNEIVPPYWYFDYESYRDSDAYVFGRGDGQDTLLDKTYGVHEDVLRFKEGVSAADLELAQRGEDLVVRIIGTSDQVTIKKFYVSTAYAIEAFEFADGVRWLLPDIKRAGWSGTAQDDVFSSDVAHGSSGQMSGGEGNDILTGMNGDELLEGGSGNDTLLGNWGNDVLVGGTGDDVLQGSFGDDVLDGGAGDDLLYAGYGADTIRFGRGDGKDVLARDTSWKRYYNSTIEVVDPSNRNVVELKEGVSTADVRLVREGTTLHIQIKGTDDVLTVKDFYITRYEWDELPEANFSLGSIRFADGTVWGPAEMQAQTLIGDESNESFTGYSGDDVFDGKGGNDKYYGWGGVDTILFGRGDGSDKVNYTQSRLVFKEDVSPNDVVVRRVQNNLVFSIKGTTDQISYDYALSYWDSEPSYIENVTFADGTTWSPAQIAQKLLEATAGDDVIADVYSASPVVLAGGEGNDILMGGRSATIYVFNRGDGHDVLDESEGYSDQDVLRFGPDIVATDLLVSISGGDLIIRIADTDDQVTIKRHAYSAIEQFEVGGVTLSYAQITELVPGYGSENIYGSSGHDVLIGSGKDSFILGFEGNDSISGGAGIDDLHGGDGNDSLAGEDGEDSLYGGNGNDSLAGGAARDRLSGGLGNNSYVYQRGDSLDTITLTPGASDFIQLGADIHPADVSVQLGTHYGYYENSWVLLKQMVIGFGGNDALVLEIPDTTDFPSALQAIGTLQFASGASLSYADLLALVDSGAAGDSWSYDENTVMRGSQGDDYITSEGRNAYQEGRDNNDTLLSWESGARQDGGDGDDYLNAGGGDALMAGGRGADEINAGTSGYDNTIAFNQGDGADWVEANAGRATLSLGANIDAANIRMRVDASGILVIRFEGSEEDEIRTYRYESDLEGLNSNRGFDKIQLINADGEVRLFDLTRLDASGEARELLLQASGDGAAFETLVQMAGLEVLEPAEVHGGAAAISYAQNGNMLGQAYIAANGDPDGDNILFGTIGAETLDGGNGNDVIMADGGDDVLLGGAGDDVLVGGAGEDVLDAGTGNNKAMGGEGDDTYHYVRGNGFLFIDDGISFDGGEGGYGGNDYNTLEFGEGITFEDLIFERDGDNLKVTVAGVEGDAVVLAGFDEYMQSRNRSIDELIFQDGSSQDLEDLWRESSDQYLIQRGNDELTGTEFRDYLQGGLGDDRLNGGNGSDRLEGGAGNDVYLLGYDSGNDVIVDTAEDDNIIVVSDWSVTIDDISLQTDGGQVGIWIGERFITLEGWDGLDAAQAPISSLILQDGSVVLDMVDLFNRPRTIVGTPQVDELQGGVGADVIRGLESNDLMLGGEGADTYVIEANSGSDTITDTSAPGQENTILFLDGVLPEDIRLTLDADQNLVIRWADGMQVTLTEFDYQNPLDTVSIAFFQFGAAGPVLSFEQLLQRGFEIDGTPEADVLYTTGLYDVVRGGDGDDVILGSAGGDSLKGGSGNDLYEYRLGDGWVGIEDVVDASGGNVVRFGEGITPEMLERKLRFNYFWDEPEENSLRIVFDEDNVLQLNGFDPSNPEGSPHAVEYFEFADGTVLSWDQLLDKVFVVEGYDEATFGDVLTGTSRSDRLYGYAGDDELHAGAGNDVLTGGQGIDVLAGGDGEDNYVFQLGDGVDVIQEAGTSVNTITFGEGVFEADISVQRDGADLVVHYGTLGDSIRIASADGVTTPRDVIQHIELADGTLLSFARFVNVAPVVGQALENQEAQAGTDFSYAISGNAFSDLDGDVLELRARLGDGQPLPEWLEFDAATGSFNGMPPAGSAGIYDVVVYAVDPSGDAVQQTFQIAVSEVQNGLPTAIADSGTVDEELEVTASGNVLANDLDPDATDVLTVSNPGTYQGQYGVLVLNPDGSYVYTLDTGSAAVQALAEGASVNEAFSYVVSDGSASDQAELTITIAGRNDLPVVTASVPNQSATEEAAWSYILPLGLFSDIDVGDVLSLEVRLANGDPLPSWLSFDPQSLTLAGTPANSDVGSLQLQVSATDQSGAVVSTQFALTVSNVNDAPQVLVNVPNQSVTAHYAFNYQIPTGAFGDEDAGDSLTYAVTLATGGALPAWLQFDPTSRMLTGKPVQADVGVLELQVVATDSQGVSASQVFQLSVSPLPIIWGTEYNDILDAYTTGAIVYGLGGNDILYGEVGNDVFYGGDGNDKLYAWDGDDLLDGGNGDDILTGDIGNDVLLGGTGNDDLFGYAGDDILYGQDGNDYFEGNAGADVLYGGLGDDTYLIEDASDQVIELSGEGNDTIESHISLTLGDHVEHLTLMGSDSIHAIGNALDNELTGNSAANTLLGHAGIDYLYGNGGDDILDGGEGADGMYGGAGNDTYYVDDASDWVQEGSNQGTDTVISTVTRNLNANFENLTLVGTASINGTGNGLANILIGNDAVNSLSGGGGSDTLDGRGGNDTLTGGAGSDTYLIGRGYGTDTVVENDSTSGNTDVAQFLAGVSADQIWFRQTGNNLEASIIGTSDALIMKNWYLGSQYQVEQFQTADGQLLLSSQVQNLVQAMAQFSPPASGETTLPSSYQADLQPVIAANWQ